MVALAFWTVRFLRRWLRHAKSTSARLALRGEQAAAKAHFVIWRPGRHASKGCGRSNDGCRCARRMSRTRIAWRSTDTPQDTPGSGRLHVPDFPKGDAREPVSHISNHLVGSD